LADDADVGFHGRRRVRRWVGRVVSEFHCGTGKYTLERAADEDVLTPHESHLDADLPTGLAGPPGAPRGYCRVADGPGGEVCVHVDATRCRRHEREHPGDVEPPATVLEER